MAQGDQKQQPASPVQPRGASAKGAAAASTAPAGEGSAPSSESEELTQPLSETQEVVHEQPPPSWGKVWQLPAIVASLGLFVIGLVMLLNAQPKTDFSKAFDDVVRLTEAGEFTDATNLLNSLADSENSMTALHKARYRLVRADLFYNVQSVKGSAQTVDQNLSQVVNDLRLAEQGGITLDAEELYQWTNSLIQLGRLKEAAPMIERIPAVNSDMRHRLIKALVLRNLSMPDMAYDQTMGYLTQLLAEPDLDADTRVWAVARVADLRMQRGFIDEAINQLLITMQKLKAYGINKFPVLFVLLGRAYFELGDYTRASDHLNFAMSQLPSGNPLRGEALLMLGRIAQQKLQWDDAFTDYNSVVSDYPGTQSYLPALMGRGEIHAQMADLPDAITDFTTAVADFDKLDPRLIDRRYIDADKITNTIIAWHDRLHNDGQLDMALRFLKVAERLYGGKTPMPDTLLSRLAQTNQELGSEMLKHSLEEAGLGALPEGARLDPADAAKLDPATRRQAQNHFLDAGAYYRKRSEAFLLTDPDTSALSLESAAKAFDRGGDYDSSIAALREFIRLSVNDPRKLWGVYMLGRSYQAMQDYDGAIAEFTQLLTDYPNSLEAQRSYVPLAQCYLVHPTKPDPGEAERLLLIVVNGKAAQGANLPVKSVELTPEASEFRNALIELGTLYARAADYKMPRPAMDYYPEAIRRLTEAINRYPDDQRINNLHYLLAHSYRLSAKVLKSELAIERPEAERLALSAERDNYLEQAGKNYTLAIEGYEDIAPHKRSAEVVQNLRYAAFWRADCAFDQGSYREAIRLYSDVADKYANDATAIVAMIQIVNAYNALGEPQAANTAQNRAWRILQRLPDNISNAGTLPLDRDAWERLLRSNRATDNPAPTKTASSESP